MELSVCHLQIIQCKKNAKILIEFKANNELCDINILYHREIHQNKQSETYEKYAKMEEKQQRTNGRKKKLKSAIALKL